MHVSGRCPRNNALQFLGPIHTPTRCDTEQQNFIMVVKL